MACVNEEPLAPSFENEIDFAREGSLHAPGDVLVGRLPNSRIPDRKRGRVLQVLKFIGMEEREPKRVHFRAVAFDQEPACVVSRDAHQLAMGQHPHAFMFVNRGKPLAELRRITREERRLRQDRAPAAWAVFSCSQTAA